MLLSGYLPRSTVRSFPLPPPEEAAPGPGFYEAKRALVSAFERDYFVTLARRCRGNISEMARQSALERHHVRAFLRKHGIDRHGM